MNTNTASLAAGTTAALVLALAGCSSNSGQDTPKTISIAPTSSAAVATLSPASGPKVYGLKDEAPLVDMTVTLGTPERDRTGKVGVPEDTSYVRVPVTLTSRARVALDMTGIDVTCMTQEVYDGTNGLEGVPDVHVLPEKSLTWDIACAQKKDDLYFQLEVTRQRDIAPKSAGDETVIFAGTIE